ncbi:MAG: glycosyltransferase [Deltaproteobacteria bacterium]|nr:glycosyltransferase [Deltaproteobacteria bacterium]
MKVVDVAEFFADRGGGVRTYIHQKLEAGLRLGHEVVVIAPGPEDREEARNGGRILWVKGPPMPFDPRYYVLWNERAVHRLLDAERPDVVEGSSPWSGGWFAARWRGPHAARAKKAFIFHQDPVAVYPQTFLGRALGTARVDSLFSPYWLYLSRLARRFDHTVVAGRWLADKLFRFGITNAVPVPFGIDKASFSPERDDGRLRDRWLDLCKVPRDAPLWVAISRFHPEKRVPTLLEAFRQVADERPMGLVLFGDGPQRASIERLAGKIHGVHLAGFVDDKDLIAGTLASADGFLHGSAAETYGLVVAEAMCSGLPLVVPDQGGAADLADDGFAELYPAGDVDACAAAMRRLLSRPRDLLRRATLAAAREKVGTMDDHFRALFELYSR